MKLFSFWYGGFEDFEGKRRETRWTVQVDRNPTKYYRLYFHIGQELLSSNDTWIHGYGYYAVGITTSAYMKSERKIQWGRHHDYYDGPHDSFGLGRLRIQWQGDWCDECMPP